MVNLFKTTQNEFYAVLFVIVSIQIILSFQGFDVCDDGFVLTFYQQIYNDPSSVEYNFVYWFSGIIGGLWYEIYPEGGILWIRCLTIIINTLTFLVAYKILKEFVNSRGLLIGLVIVLFVNDFGFLTYYHNNITALLALISIYFFSKGIEKTNFTLLMLAGFFLGVNVFSRIPNVTLFIFILSIPYSWYLHQKRMFKHVMAPILGVVLGVFVVYITLYVLGHLTIMKNALISLFNLGKTDGSSHNIVSLFYTYVRHYKMLFVVFSQLLVITIILKTILLYLNKNKWLKNAVIIVMFFLAMLWFKKVNIYVIYVIGYIGTLGIMFTKQNTKHIKVIAFLAFLMMSFLPLGSGGGIYSSGYMCIWLAVPLFIKFVSQFRNAEVSLGKEKETFTSIVSKKHIRYVSMFFFFSFITGKAYNISQEAYFDPGSRFDKSHTINNKYTKGIYTTERRATIINDLLVNLEKYVAPNDYLLAYDKIPMIHFLTETKPYMFNSWVWIYDSYSFKTSLERAEHDINGLPIIVQQKFETIFSFSEPTLLYLTNEIENDERYNNGFDKKRVQLMNDFISRHNYEIVWSNAYFNIYKSNKDVTLD